MTNKNDNITRNLKNYIIGTIIGTVSTILFMLLCAFIIVFAGLDRAISEPLATLCVAIGTVVAAFYSSFKIGNKGLVTGFIIAIIFFMVITAVSLLIDGSGFSLNSVFHLVIILLSGLIGGVLGVNRKTNKKYI